VFIEYVASNDLAFICCYAAYCLSGDGQLFCFIYIYTVLFSAMMSQCIN